MHEGVFFHDFTVQTVAIHLRINLWVFGFDPMLVWNESGKFKSRVDICGSLEPIPT